MDRALRDTAFTVQVTNYDTNGTPADVGGTWTATIVDSAGTAIAGSPFAVTSLGSGVYQATITPQHILDVYSVTWNVPDSTKRYTEFEVVGGFYFTLPEIRGFDPALANFTADKIRAARDVVEERFEDICNVAFVPRGRRYTAEGTGTYNLMVPDVELRAVTAATIQVAIGSPGVTISDLATVKVYPYGMIQRSNGLWNLSTYGLGQNVSIRYECGMDQPPGAVKRAALQYARHLLLPSAFDDDRVIGYSTDVGFARVETARGGMTGYPEIDSVLALYQVSTGKQGVMVW